MGNESVLFQSEERMDIKSVSDLLHQLADRLAQDQIILRQGMQEIKVSVPDRVVLELKVEEELKKANTQRSLEIEISWIEGDDSQGPIMLS